MHIEMDPEREGGRKQTAFDSGQEIDVRYVIENGYLGALNPTSNFLSRDCHLERCRTLLQ
jgi:hypothetical protein